MELCQNSLDFQLNVIIIFQVATCDACAKYVFDRTSTDAQKEHRLSFCINLEVVIFQDSEFGLFLEEVLKP